MCGAQDQGSETAMMEGRTMPKEELLFVCEDIGIVVNESMSRAEIKRLILEKASEDQIEEAIFILRKFQTREEERVKKEKEKQEREKEWEFRRQQLENERQALETRARGERKKEKAEWELERKVLENKRQVREAREREEREERDRREREVRAVQVEDSERRVRLKRWDEVVSRMYVLREGERIECFLASFEKVCEKVKLDRSYWSLALLGVLPSDVSEVLACLPEERYKDYDAAKRALFWRFGVAVKERKEDTRRERFLETREQEGAVCEIASNKRARLYDGVGSSRVENAESEAAACRESRVVPQGAPCLDNARSSRPDRVSEELETSVVPKHASYLPEIEKDCAADKVNTTLTDASGFVREAPAVKVVSDSVVEVEAVSDRVVKAEPEGSDGSIEEMSIESGEVFPDDQSLDGGRRDTICSGEEQLEKLPETNSGETAECTQGENEDLNSAANVCGDAIFCASEASGSSVREEETSAGVSFHFEYPKLGSKESASASGVRKHRRKRRKRTRAAHRNGVKERPGGQQASQKAARTRIMGKCFLSRSVRRRRKTRVVSKRMRPQQRKGKIRFFSRRIAIRGCSLSETRPARRKARVRVRFCLRRQPFLLKREVGREVDRPVSPLCFRSARRKSERKRPRSRITHDDRTSERARALCVWRARRPSGPRPHRVRIKGIRIR